jgi:hypothetical protein
MTTATNVGATYSTTPAVTTLCPTTGGLDVWFKFLVPATGNFKIQTSAGTLTDAVMTMYYANTCQQLAPHQCVDDANGSTMPEIIGTGYIAGSEIFVRVWGKNNSTGTFSICVKDGIVPRLAAVSEVNLYPNPAVDFITLENRSNNFEPTGLSIYNATGSLVINDFITEPTHTIDISKLSAGIYIAKYGNNTWKFVKTQP